MLAAPLRPQWESRGSIRWLPGITVPYGKCSLSYHTGPHPYGMYDMYGMYCTKYGTVQYYLAPKSSTPATPTPTATTTATSSLPGRATCCCLVRSRVPVPCPVSPAQPSPALPCPLYRTVLSFFYSGPDSHQDQDPRGGRPAFKIAFAGALAGTRDRSSQPTFRCSAMLPWPPRAVHERQ